MRDGRILRKDLLEADGKEGTEDNHHRTGQLRKDNHPQYYALQLDKLHLNEVKQTVPSSNKIT